MSSTSLNTAPFIPDLGDILNVEQKQRVRRLLSRAAKTGAAARVRLLDRAVEVYEDALADLLNERIEKLARAGGAKPQKVNR